jgi:hypothetical protein
MDPVEDDEIEIDRLVIDLPEDGDADEELGAGIARSLIERIDAMRREELT